MCNNNKNDQRKSIPKEQIKLQYITKKHHKPAVIGSQALPKTEDLSVLSTL